MQAKGIHTDLFKYHCIIHQQNLIGKDLGFNNVMNKVVKAVNFIRSSTDNLRNFLMKLSVNMAMSYITWKFVG